MAMQQFEKWWNEHRGGALMNFPLDKKHNSEVWKAALEWVEDVASRNKDKKTLVEIIKELESGY